ncbi:biosynthetic-type acetolactate synthase large subunit [Desulfonatronum thiodismutans]|uniref:biosynthetic-type acetolactate synthase large subunit n=1 Tax=Desulfonatronum thiodismutans TaxID=159290 RepID=UPI0004ABD999|nr:biosynthetic-type acetolactate synthase large subunit [Desulfonatronum thiodismutans]
MISLSGAELAVALLERQHVRIIAGIPGGANLPLYDALSRSSCIRHILTRHEQGAGFLTQGMARVTGAPAVCFATSGPGATNVLTAIADAKLDSVPLICVTGQVPRSLMGTDAFQEVDTYGMSIPLTKHNYLVRSARELLTVIPEAFSIAASGRPGPVLIDVPRDVQLERVGFAQWPEPGEVDPAPVAYDADIEAAAGMINAAKRPVLWVGGGAVAAGTQDRIKQLAETASMPVALTLMGLAAMDRDHPLCLGMLGMHAERGTNMVLEACDLILAAGVRFDDRATGRVQEFCPQAKIIHVDIDHSEIDKIRTASLGILADIRAVFDALLPRVTANPRGEWLEYIAALKRAFPPLAPTSGGHDTPQRLIRRVGELAPPDAVVVTDVGKHQMWTAQSYPFTRRTSWLTSGGLGTMGFGLPTAIGASMAAPTRKVVCFSGDGSLLMNIQEMATAAEQQADVTVVLFNNNCLGLVHQQQELFFNANCFSSTYSIEVDFPGIARAFGWHVRDLADASDPDAVLSEAMAHKGPSLVHVPVAREERVLPMVPPGAANRTMIEEVANV